MEMKKICSLVIILGVERIASPVRTEELESFVSLSHQNNKVANFCDCMKLNIAVLHVAYFMCNNNCS